MRNDAADTRTIDIYVLLDMALVLQEAPGPEENAVTPTRLDHEQGYMLVTATGGVTNQGTGDVAFDARAGDVVRFFVTSGSNNFEQAVLLQDIRHAGGDEVLEGFECVTQQRTGIAPASVTSVLPARLVPRRFWFRQSEVAREGTGSYHLVFALYDRDEQGRPRFAGHYQWDPRLTVRFSPPPPER